MAGRRRINDLLRYDLPASLVVFLVAVPLSLGIAVASGAPVLAGLLAAVVGGVLAGLLGGSVLQVSGPAAGLTVVVAELIHSYGWRVTCLITVGAGLLQLLFGLSRAARAALAVSPAVVHGMLAGIGVTIVLAQLHVVFGGSPSSSALSNLTALPGQVITAHGVATAIGIGVAVVLLAWPRLPGLRRVPGPLVAVAGATVLATVAALEVPRVAMPGSLLSEIHLPELPQGGWPGIALAVLTVALIASVESLLSAVAVDRMHGGQAADLDRELVGQGTANMVSGLVGGLPVTGVIVRSAANVRAGGRSRASAVLHGIWVLVFAVFLVGVVRQIPLAALAGLLVVVGLKLVDIEYIRTLHRHRELTVYVATLGTVVVFNLLAGVLIGIAVGLVLMLRRLVVSTVYAEPVEHSPPGRWHVALAGRLSFLGVPRLARVLCQIPTGAHVYVEVATDYLDHGARDYLNGWRDRHAATGGTVIMEVHEPVTRARGISPWSHRQRSTGSVALPGQRLPHRAGEAVSAVLAGLREFHRDSAPLVRPWLAQLADGQQPQAVFVTCADSRVMPNLLTSSGPGDLFTVRNIGNLVPPDQALDAPDVSVGAALEYAVGVLGVPAVVVCGHSGCGAMQAALDGQAPAPGSLARWLRLAESSLARWRAGDPVGVAAAADGRSELDQLVMVNIAQQLANLRTHEVIANAVDEGRTRLVGLFFDMAEARLHLYDESIQRFVPLPETGSAGLPGLVVS